MKKKKDIWNYEVFEKQVIVIQKDKRMKDTRKRIDFILRSKLIDLIYPKRKLGDKCPFCDFVPTFFNFPSRKAHEIQSLMTHLAYNHKKQYPTKLDLIMKTINC